MRRSPSAGVSAAVRRYSKFGWKNNSCLFKHCCTKEKKKKKKNGIMKGVNKKCISQTKIHVYKQVWNIAIVKPGQTLRKQFSDCYLIMFCFSLNSSKKSLAFSSLLKQFVNVKDQVIRQTVTPQTVLQILVTISWKWIKTERDFKNMWTERKRQQTFHIFPHNYYKREKATAEWLNDIQQTTKH